MVIQKNAFIDVNPIIITSENKIVLAKRKIELVEGGKWHLPGGRVRFNETFRTTLKRMAFAKTNLEVKLIFGSLKENLVGIYDYPNRDPREHVVSLSFLCKVVSGQINPGDQVDLVKSFNETEVEMLEIAFDHKKTIKDAFDILEKMEVKIKCVK